MPTDGRKLVSIVSGCYNEEENVTELCRQVRTIMQGLGKYDYEHILIDNCSTDRTVEVLRGIAKDDPRVKVIVNARNFGHVRSPAHAMLLARGDAVIMMASDLQDPPELIPQFLEKWETGTKLVLGVKAKSRESFTFWLLRSVYYRLLRSLSDVELVEHFTGFGLYDRQVVEIIRKMDDPYPYVRGMIADIGFKSERVPFVQPRRKRGITKSNFYILYDLAMLGMTSHTKVPLRLTTMLGFACAFASLLIAVAYLVYKLLYWKSFALGLAPLVIGIYFLGSVQLIFLGIVGEYIGAIHTTVQKRPLVVEKERINF